MAAGLPTTMRAVKITAPGGAEVLALVDTPVPRPAAGQLLVRVDAVGVNRADIILRQPDLPLPVAQRPTIPGLEVAGTVVAIGEGVDESLLDQDICALVPGAGGYADYCLVPAALAWPVPAGLSKPQAAALPEGLLTVWNALFDEPVLQAGETLLVHGGSSGIGAIAIMMARAFGADVLATAGSDKKCAAIAGWGAARAINYRSEDFVEAARAHTNGRGVDVILDMVSGSYIERNVQALAEGGRLVEIGMIQSPSGSLNVAPLMAKRARIIGASLWFQSLQEKARLAATISHRIWPLVENGTIVPVIDCIMPLAQAADAQRRLEASVHIGKVVLAPDASGA